VYSRRSATAKNEDPDLVVCSYGESVLKRPRKEKDTNRIAMLEEKLAQLESRVPGPSSAFVEGETPFQTSPPNQLYDYPIQNAQYTQQQPASNFPLFLTADAIANPGGWPAPNAALLNSYSFPDSSQGRFQTADEIPSNTITDEIMQDLLYPGWPTDLPSPAIVNSLVALFFDKPSAYSGLLSREGFLSRLILPCRHMLFPSTSLIHAILTLALTQVSSDAYGLANTSFYVEQISAIGSSCVQTPAAYHASRAKHHIDDSLANGRNYIEQAQAYCLYAYYLHGSGAYALFWMAASATMRLLPPCLVNHLEGMYMKDDGSVEDPQDAKDVRPKCLIPPPIHEEERRERALLFWFAYSLDRSVAALLRWLH